MGKKTKQYEVTDGKDANNVELKKGVGLLGGISIIVGIIIGSGIFISPQGVAKGTGSVGLCLLSWVLCGLISLVGGLCYCELGMLLKESGGELAYLDAAFGKAPAFIFSWLNLFIRPAACAATTMTSSQYLIALYLGDCAIDLTPMKLFAQVILWFGVIINCYSVKATMRVQIIFTFAKVAALIAIVLGGAYRVARGSTDTLASGFEGTETDAGKIFLGLYGGLYAYDGWNGLNFVYEEVQNPEKNLPRAVIMGVLSVTVIYVLTNVAYFSVLSMDEMINSPAVVVTWANRIAGPYIAWMVPVAVAMSAYGGFNGQLFTSGRICYVAARKGLQVKLLSMLHVKRCTPVPAILFTAAISSAFIMSGDILALVNFMSFLLWMFYALAVAALIFMRYRLPHKNFERPYKVPTALAFIFLILAVLIVIVPIILQPQMELIYAVIFMLVGLVFYIPFVYLGKELPCMDKFTILMQKTLYVVSPDMQQAAAAVTDSADGKGDEASDKEA